MGVPRSFKVRHKSAVSGVILPRRKVAKVPGEQPLEVLDERTFNQRIANIPFVSALALRAYIEEKAQPLAKTIALANGEKVNGVQPSWDDQKQAIRDLLPKVAPDLKQVEVTYRGSPDEDGADTGETIANRVVERLTQLAYGKRAQEAVTVTSSYDRGKSEVGREGEA